MHSLGTEIDAQACNVSYWVCAKTLHFTPFTTYLHDIEDPQIVRHPLSYRVCVVPNKGDVTLAKVTAAARDIDFLVLQCNHVSALGS